MDGQLAGSGSLPSRTPRISGVVSFSLGALVIAPITLAAQKVFRVARLPVACSLPFSLLRQPVNPEGVNSSPLAASFDFNYWRLLLLCSKPNRFASLKTANAIAAAFRSALENTPFNHFLSALPHCRSDLEFRKYLPSVPADFELFLHERCKKVKVIFFIYLLLQFPSVGADCADDADGSPYRTNKASADGNNSLEDFDLGHIAPLYFWDFPGRLLRSDRRSLSLPRPLSFDRLERTPAMMKTYSHIRRQALNQAAEALEPNYPATGWRRNSSTDQDNSVGEEKRWAFGGLPLFPTQV